MEDQQIRALIRKYLDGQCSEEEASVMENWYLRQPENFQRPDTVLIERNEKLMRDFLVQAIVPPKKVRLWPRIAVAAAVATVIFGAGLFYFQHTRVKNDLVAVGRGVHDVAPGKQGATLTLASGKKIRLAGAANGELAREAGVEITKTADGQVIYEMKKTGLDDDRINTLATERGETYVLTLPDRSKVWLNAASSLTYRASLNERGRRVVKLSGEAYFEVAKDKAHPFVVETAGQKVEVLGTHFNVNAYGDEPGIATTLLEGSVRVSAGNESRKIVPGQQALNKGGQLKVAKVDMENITDWKDGEFNLDNLDFRTAMRKIARWYDVEVVYDKSVPEDIELGGWIPRDSKLSSIVKLIENAGLVRCRIEGRKVYVYK